MAAAEYFDLFTLYAAPAGVERENIERFRNGAPVRLLSSVQTCWACPYQWDAFPVSGGYLYLRYRHARGTVEFAPSQNEFLSHGAVLLDAWADDHDRDLDLEEFCASTNLIPPPLEMQFGRIFDEF